MNGTAAHETAPASGRITPAMRKRVIERDEGVCQICGAQKGDMMEDGRAAWVVVSHHIKPRFGGVTEMDNLEVACRMCHYGGQNIDHSKPSIHLLIGDIKRAPIEQQREAFEMLKKKFGEK